MCKSQSVNVSMRVNATARLLLKVNFLQEKHVLEMLTLAACHSAQSNLRKSPVLKIHM